MNEKLKLLKQSLLANIEESTVIPFSHQVRPMFSKYIAELENENESLEQRLAEHQSLAQRTLLILEEANFFECDGDGFSQSSLHRDLSKVANGKEFKDIVRLQKLTIEALRSQLEHSQNSANIFTVWVGGTEVVNHYVDYAKALSIKKDYEDQGYDDIQIAIKDYNEN